MEPKASLPLFPSFAKWTATVAGKPATFTVCILLILVWAITGPMFDYSDSWQLVVNTGTHDHNVSDGFFDPEYPESRYPSATPEARRIIRVTKGARNLLLDLEQLDDEQLEKLRQVYERLGQKARRANGDE